MLAVRQRKIFLFLFTPDMDDIVFIEDNRTPCQSQDSIFGDF